MSRVSNAVIGTANAVKSIKRKKRQVKKTAKVIKKICVTAGCSGCGTFLLIIIAAAVVISMIAGVIASLNQEKKTTYVPDIDLTRIEEYFDFAFKQQLVNKYHSTEKVLMSERFDLDNIDQYRLYAAFYVIIEEDLGYKDEVQEWMKNHNKEYTMVNPFDPSAREQTKTGATWLVEFCTKIAWAFFDANSYESPLPQESGAFLYTPHISASLDVVLALNGLTTDIIEDQSCSQLVTITPEGLGKRFCEIRVWEKENSEWVSVGETYEAALPGSDTILADPIHNSRIPTFPTGLFYIGQAFYKDSSDYLNQPFSPNFTYSSRPITTGLRSFKITDKTLWITDPSSSHYNSRVLSDVTSKDWNSSVNLYDGYKYNLGFIIRTDVNKMPTDDDTSTETSSNRSTQVNTFVIADDSLSVSPNERTMAMKTEQMRKLLEILNASKNPEVIISGFQKDVTTEYT